MTRWHRVLACAVALVTVSALPACGAALGSNGAAERAAKDLTPTDVLPDANALDGGSGGGVAATPPGSGAGSLAPTATNPDGTPAAGTTDTSGTGGGTPGSPATPGSGAPGGTGGTGAAGFDPSSPFSVFNLPGSGGPGTGATPFTVPPTTIPPEPYSLLELTQDTAECRALTKVIALGNELFSGKPLTRQQRLSLFDEVVAGWNELVATSPVINVPFDPSQVARIRDSLAASSATEAPSAAGLVSAIADPLRSSLDAVLGRCLPAKDTAGKNPTFGATLHLPSAESWSNVLGGAA